MRIALSTLLLLLAGSVLSSFARAEPARVFDREEGRYVEVAVADPYLELHTGPGRSYPVFRVVPRGDKVQILFQRTDWFRVRDDQDKEGWAYYADMGRTLLASGEKLPLIDLRHRDFAQAPWEAGMQSGNFGGGNVNSLWAGYAINPKLTAELSVSQTISRADDGAILLAGLTHTPRPDLRLAPFLELGTGAIRIRPQATILEPPSRVEQVAYYGVGAKFYLTHRLFLRADYRSYVIFTRLAQNEDRNEWKVGFGFFF